MRFPLRASPVLTVLTAAVHAGAAAILAVFLPGLAGTLAAALVLILGALGVAHKGLLMGGSSPVALELGGDGRLGLLLRAGGELRGEPAERRLVNRWLVVMTLVSPAGESRTLLVARDMLAAADFRQLRLWALWKVLPATRSTTAAAG